MTTNPLDDITIIIPCYNEGSFIHEHVKRLRKIGFNSILVIDDNSKDNTSEKALGAKANVIKNNNLLGFSMTVLKGLYSIKTKAAVIYTPDEFIENDKDIIEFIEFGLMGNYSILISKSTEDSGNLSNIFKKKFGIFLPEPGFEFVYLNQTIIHIIKSKVGSTDTNIYFDIIKQVVKNDLKIGVYPIRFVPIKHILPFPRKVRRFFRIRNQEKYFEYIFPDIEKKVALNQVGIAFIGYILIRAFELLIVYFKGS